MSSSEALEAATTVLCLAFVATGVTSLLVAGPADTTLRRLVLGTRFARAAVGLAAMLLLTTILNIPHAGVVWTLPSAILLAVGAGAAIAARNRRDLKGEQVVADAERTVRDYTPPIGRS